MTQHVALPDPSQDDAPGPVNFTDGDHIGEVLAKAGFGDVTADPIDTVSVFGRDAEEAAEFVFGWGPVRHWLRDADPTAVAGARRAVEEALLPLELDGAVRLHSPNWLFTAVRAQTGR